MQWVLHFAEVQGLLHRNNTCCRSHALLNKASLLAAAHEEDDPGRGIAPRATLHNQAGCKIDRGMAKQGTHGFSMFASHDQTCGQAPAQDEAVFDVSYMATVGMGEASLGFMQGIPVGSVLCCTSHLVRAEGRRSVFRGQIQDRPGGKTFATGEAEFVTALTPGMPALQKPLLSRL